MRALRLLPIGLLVLVACSGAPASRPPVDAGPTDAGTALDAGPAADAGPTDAGPEDAGPAPDSGPIDAGPVDAGLDAGPTDAGPVDAGPVDAGPVDAGPVDAGPEDAGPVDAGPEDAGPPDAGPPDAGPERDAGPPNTLITVDLSSPGAVVPDDFLGLSVEWSHVPDYLGDTTGQPRPQVIQLLSQFAADGHHPVLRIGGNSEDLSSWNPSGTAPVDITGTHLSILNAINAATGSRFVLGLNLASSDSANAASLVTASLGALPANSIEAFELGNEPDLYFYPSGYRPFYYSPPLYLSDFSGYFPDLSNAASNQPMFAGPALYSTPWYSSLSTFLSTESGRLSLVTMHRYPYNVCISTATGPSIQDLFSDTATKAYATQFQPIVQTAAQAGLGMRVAEMNSVSCGGLPGVSDVFAAGLWGTDAMFELASIGAAGMNFHTPSHYAVFDFDSSGALEVRGLYYAMLLFSRATAQQGRWLPTNVQSQIQVRAWSTLGSDGAARFAIVNEDLHNPATVHVQFAPGGRPALLWQLTASAIDAATDITFGAQTYQGSTDGNPIGSPDGEVVNQYDGHYQVVMPPGSAALLVVPQ